MLNQVPAFLAAPRAGFWPGLILFLIAVSLYTPGLVHSSPLRLGEKVFLDELKDKDHKFVTDPSANSHAFQKEGDMTFFIGTDLALFRGVNTAKPGQNTERDRRNAVLDTRYIWPGSVIPYEISTVFNEHDKYVILSAMNSWEEKTCIRFRPKNSSDEYWVFVISGQGCQSFVGRIPYTSLQPQGVTLGPGCVTFATVLHELGHAIGLYHEHNRPDRDDYVEIKYGNVAEGAERAFSKYVYGVTNLLSFGYDYASVMHYRSDFFSWNGHDTICAKNASIPFGGAEELSPLDIAKVTALYNCKCPRPPIMTAVPPKPMITLQQGITCGQVVSGNTSGMLTSPGYPEYRHNLDCAYIINPPNGYYLQVQLPNFAIEESSNCAKDYVQFYYGDKVDSSNRIDFTGLVEGRLCDSQYGQYIYTLYGTATVYFHTDGSGSGTRGLKISYNIIDTNECESNSECVQCTNYPGGYDCVCKTGYYFSAPAGKCYDINECAFNNGGCQHKCNNTGGSYRCECNMGYYLDSDGKSCVLTKPTGSPPTKCGSHFITATGILQTPNWPQTYPTDVDCEWLIRLPDSCKVVEVSCDVEPYGIDGTYPGCTTDSITLYDGHNSSLGTTHGPYCGSKKPGIIKMSSHLAKIVFHAGPSPPSSTVSGVKCTYRSVSASSSVLNATSPPPSTTTSLPSQSTVSPATAPPTTTPTPTAPPTCTPLPMSSPECGGNLTATSDSFQTPNWPETYPVNVDCVWTIVLPDSSKRVQITIGSGFGIAGRLPDCVRDQVYVIDDCDCTRYGPFCHFAIPSIPLMSSNKATVVLHAGPRHNPSRRGFTASYNSV